MNAVTIEQNAPQQDRLVFTVFLAILFHAILILGLDFTGNLNISKAHTLEITLALHNDENAPKQADFLAEFNQQGSGSEAEKAEISTDQKADFHSDVINQVQLKTPSAPTVQKDHSQRKIVTTIADSDKSVPVLKKKQKDLDLLKSNQVMLLEQTNKIASLEAQLRAQKQAYAKRPRIRQVTSVTTLAHKEASYIQAFRQRIEEMGNRHFPKQALREGRFGSARLLVAIKADGSLHDVQIRKSSGLSFIDEAAVASVRLAAPFPPFPAEIKKDTDILEIIRTWKFDEKKMITSNI